MVEYDHLGKYDLRQSVVEAGMNAILCCILSE